MSTSGSINYIFHYHCRFYCNKSYNVITTARFFYLNIVKSSAFAYFLANFSLVLLLKVTLIKRRVFIYD